MCGYIFFILKLLKLTFCFKHIQLSRTVKLYMWNNLIQVYKTLKCMRWSIYTLKYIKMQKNLGVSSCFSSQIHKKVLCIYSDVMLQLKCWSYQTRLDKANFQNTILIKLVPWCGSLIMFWPCCWVFNAKRYF